MTPFFAIVLAATVSASPADVNTTFKALKFREIGPAVMGGRIDAITAVESNPDIIYVGTASGGVLKSTNGGTTWEPMFDDQPTSTIGDIAVSQSDPSVVWVGTGESNNRQSSSWGNGVYKSTDGGKSWQHAGLDETHHIGRIVISPNDPNTVYVAAAGKLWGPSKERGVYKTTDGGKTWTNVLFVNEDTGVNDIAMDPGSPNTLIAAAYQRRRTVFGFNGSGSYGGLYKTTDGGVTWKKLEKGLPWDPNPAPSPRTPALGEGGGGGGGGAFGQQQPATPPPPKIDPDAIKEIGRIGVAFYRRDPNVVYALVEHAGGGVFRSDDKGETWTKMSETNPRGSYYSQIRVDPNNDQRLWVHGAQMFYSEDGGKTFRSNLIQRIHGDYHATWIDPHDSNHMITGSDGGIYISHDRGHSWDFVNVFPLGQFYEVGFDMARPYHICGGLQDNNVWCGPSATMDTRGIGNFEWFTVAGGDGFYAQIDPTDPNTVYSESQDGNLNRRDLKTHESRNIRPLAPESERYRFQWNSPIVISAFDARTIYYGGNYLFKSTDRGDNWTRLGPDLTNGQDRDKLAIMGKVPDKYTLSRHDGVQSWPAITTVSESPMNKDLLWVGTDDGNLQISRDGGKSWKNVFDRVRGVPKGTYVSRVLASRHNEGTAYATFDGHRSSDFNVYAFMTSDYGETWKAIRTGIPDDAGTLHVIREHYRNPKLLFAGTERAMFISTDQGAHWSKLRLNMPTVPVDDIAIHPRENDLIVGTHGRSIWIFDDLTPFEQWSDAVAAEDLHLFDIRPATEWRVANRAGFIGQKTFFGPNPPNGAIINYYLKSKPDEKERVRVTVTDSAGKLVRELDGTKEPGLNRVVWDLRARSVTTPPRLEEPTAGTPAEAETAESAAETPAAGGGFGGFGGAMRVEPGEYTVKIAVGKNEQTKKVTVEEDPRINISTEDRSARRQALTQLGQLATSAVTTRRGLTGLRTSLNTEIESWKRPGTPKPSETIQKTAEDLLKKVEEACKKFGTTQQCGERAGALGSAGPTLVYTPPPLTQRITQLLGSIEGYTAAPSASQLDQIKIIQGLLTEANAAARELTQKELAALNKMMNDAGVPHITAPGLGRPGAAPPAGEDVP